MQYDFDIVHKAGSDHQAAEEFLQIITKGTVYSDIEDATPIVAVVTSA